MHMRVFTNTAQQYLFYCKVSNYRRLNLFQLMLAILRIENIFAEKSYTYSLLCKVNLDLLTRKITEFERNATVLPFVIIYRFFRDLIFIALKKLQVLAKHCPIETGCVSLKTLKKFTDIVDMLGKIFFMYYYNELVQTR